MAAHLGRDSLRSRMLPESPFLTWSLITIFAALLLFLAHGFHLRLRWKLKHIPGPPPAFLFGNWGMVNPLWVVWSQITWPKKYGPVLRYFVGTEPYIMISDPDLIYQISVGSFATFPDRKLPSFYNFLTWEDKDRGSWELSWARGKRWSSIRKALDPLFTPKVLKETLPDMVREGEVLVESLEAERGDSVPVLDALFTFTFRNLLFGTFGVQRHGPVAKLREGSWSMFNLPVARLYGLLCITFPLFKQAFALLAGRFFIGHPMFHQLTYCGAYYDAASLAMLCNARKASGKQSGLEQHTKVPPGKLNPCRKLQEEAREEGFADFKDHTPVEDTFFYKLQEVTSKEGKGGSVEVVQLTDQQICYQSNLIITAGVESVSLSIGFALYELAQKSEMQERVRREAEAFYASNGAGAKITYNDLKHFEYTHAVVKETLRKYPPVGAHLNAIRLPEKDVQLGGYLIPKGIPVVMNSFGMAWDEKYFAQPKEFIPERFLESGKAELKPQHPHAYIPFGAGPRRCIGYKLAEAECILSLVAITRKFRYTVDPKHHPPGEPLQLKTSWVVKPADGIWLKMEPSGLGRSEE